MVEDPRVYVIDDDLAVVESLQALVEVSKLQVECHTNPRAFLETVDPSRPGCAVADLRMPGMSGIELQDALAERGVPLPVIILTGHGDIAHCVQAIKRGAVNFLEKPCPPEVLVDAIREALEIASRRYAQFQQYRDFYARLERLDAKEREVLAAITRGMTIPEIAAATMVNEKTIRFHHSRQMPKMGAHLRQAVQDLVFNVGWPTPARFLCPVILS